MESLGFGWLLISSLLFGSSLSMIVSRLLGDHLPFELFSAQIPGVSQSLIEMKTFDLLDFVVTGVSALCFLGVNFLIWKKIGGKKGKLGLVVINLMAGLLFIQTHFVTFSGKQVLLLILGFEIVFGILLWWLKKREDKEESEIAWMNGLLAGFFLMLILNQLTTVVVLSFAMLFVGPIFFGKVLKKRWSESFPGLLVLIALLLPTNMRLLLLLGGGILVTWGVIYRWWRDLFLKKLFSWLYPAAIVGLIAYNPNFFIGNFDSIEEGFWLGWVERLVRGERLYVDVAVYHPPLLIWLMAGLTKIWGVNVWTIRWGLHLMQIVGAIIYLFFLKSVIRRNWIVWVVMVVFFGFTSTLVRNNVEFRLGSGLIVLLAVFEYLKSKKIVWAAVTGILAAGALFMSFETGLAAIIASVVGMVLVGKVWKKGLVNYGLGLGGGVAVVLSKIYLEGGLGRFWEQVSFYAGAFSKGYFNTQVERSISLSFFHWHIFNQYLGSNAMFWEFGKLMLIGGILLYGFKAFWGGGLNVEDKKILVATLYGGVLFRSALGRSDWYHLLFTLLVSMAILGVVIEYLSKKNPVLSGILAFSLLFLFARPAVQSSFLEGLIFRLQTYGRIVGTYKNYKFDRGEGITLGEEVDPTEMNRLVDYIQKEVGEKEKIFSYPWMPELYFYTDRGNATTIDTPYAFFSEKYQKEMVKDLDKAKLVVYNKTMNFGGLSVESLPMVNSYIVEKFETVETFWPYVVMKKK